MELIIRNDYEQAMPLVTITNFDELYTELSEQLERYNNLLITEDTIRDGKADRARLNKLREALETRRKEIKKQCAEPYNAFEKKVKELTALIDKPIAAIDAQLAAYEDQRKEEKHQQVRELYAAIVPDTLQDIIPFELIFLPKWVNATTTIKSIEEELTALVKRTNADMMVIDTVEPEYAAAVREEYIRTLDIEQAMNKKKKLQEAAEAFRRREEEKANEREAEPPKPQQEPPETPWEPEKLYMLRLEFQLTQAQAGALKKFLAENSITYNKI